jgi:hypothetical protein
MEEQGYCEECKRSLSNCNCDISLSSLGMLMTCSKCGKRTTLLGWCRVCGVCKGCCKYSEIQPEAVPYVATSDSDFDYEYEDDGEIYCDQALPTLRNARGK